MIITIILIILIRIIIWAYDCKVNVGVIIVTCVSIHEGHGLESFLQHFWNNNNNNNNNNFCCR